MKPTEKPSSMPGEATAYEHEAFGVISMVTSTKTGGGEASGEALFGSDLRHRQVLSIKVSRATLNRSLNRDWVHEEQTLMEFEMSHAQFAQFITSNGNGQGTPITLRVAPEKGSRLSNVPPISKEESRLDSMRGEVQASASSELSNLQARVNDLGRMIEGGKVSMKDLKELHRDLVIRMENLPKNLAYAVKTAEEAMSKSVSDAKIEIEAYADNVARRIGLESLGQLAPAPNRQATQIEQAPEEDQADRRSDRQRG